jgi:Flp pilus assembly protein TadD
MNRTAMVFVSLLMLSACASLPAHEDTFALASQADAAYHDGDWVAAEQGYLALIEAVPTDAYAYFRLANTLARQGRWQGAINAYTEALKRDPQLTKAYNNLATVYLLQAEYALEAGLASLRPEHRQHSPLVHKLEELRRIAHIPVQETPSPAAGITGPMASQ